MENEINLSVAIIEPRKGLLRIFQPVSDQAAVAAEAGADVILIPKYTEKSDDVLKAYYSAMHFNPDIAVFTPTQGANKLYSGTQGANKLYLGAPNKPRPGLEYEVIDLGFERLKGSDYNLHLLVLFFEKKIEPEPSVFNRVRPGGYLFLLDNHGNHVVSYRHAGEKRIPVVENFEKKINRRSWYDLIF